MQNISERASPAGYIPFDKWLAGYGRTRQTGHRWRKQIPWLNDACISLMGRLYITAAAAQRFQELAAAGELRRYIHPLPPLQRGPKAGRKAKTKAAP